MNRKEEITRRREALSVERQAWLEKRLRGEMPNNAISSTGIPRRSPDQPVLLSFAQQRLWFLDQLMPKNPAYNEQIVIPIRFDVNPDILQRSLNEIIRRHEILRTTFTATRGEPIQVIAPHLAIDLPLVDLSYLPPPSRKAEVERVAASAIQKPFDLTYGPLLRALLLRIDVHNYILLMIMHHIICDGWSMEVIGRELDTIYPALASGQTPSLPELPIQYGDFAIWERQRLLNGEIDHQLAYWRKQLAGLATLQMPTDYPRPPVPSFQGGYHPLSINKELADKLKALSLQNQVTLFMTLVATFALLLHRYTDQQDIVIGIPNANRGHTELEGLIGFFVNTLVFRFNLSNDPTFLQLLKHVKDITLTAFANQDVSFEKLVEELQPERDLSRNPLCQVALQLISIPGTSPVEIGAEQPLLQGGAGTSKFDLRIDLSETTGGLQGRIEYSSDLFSAETIDRIAGHYQRLLAAVTDEPEANISTLPLLTLAERQQQLVGWNATEEEFPKDTCLHNIFEAHAEQAPESVAVVFDDQAFSYDALNRSANKLARFLRASGVERETPIGVCTGSSIELIISFLAILKAGGAYVPLDPDYPLDRLAFMIEDAQLGLILARQATLDSLPDTDANIILVGDLQNDYDQLDDSNLDDDILPENLAYIIFTSGSTGRPKGVLLEHRGLCNVGQAQVRAFQTGASSRVLQFSSISFDASIFEIVMAFYSGAQLHMGSRESLMPGPPLAEFLRKHQVTIVTLPPSALAVLPPWSLPALKTITVAGEACPQALVTQWAPGRKFFNLYGPTEGTIWSTYADCVSSMHKPPIGRPIANTQVYVLDQYMNPVPIGVQGELHVGGCGVARGYLNRPQLTRERFIPDPFSNVPGARLYRTGDRVRYQADGQLEFLGRWDNQVKLRGFRIELGEIEATLRQYESVDDAVVIDYVGADGDKYLIAYVASDQNSIAAEALRSHLRLRMPEFMIPAHYVFLKTLPRLPSGKLDRRSLSPPEIGIQRAGRPYVPPQTTAEMQIATIWQELLSLDHVGLDDNFFEIGGHSLLLARLYTELVNMFATDLSMIDLFRFPTVRLQSQHVNQKEQELRIRPGIQERAQKKQEAMRQARDRRKLQGRGPRA